MQKVFRYIWRWLLRIFLGILALVLLLFLLFYLFRGKITERAVAYVNDMQPGEIVLDKISLRPFLDFPDVSVRIRDVAYRGPEDPGINNDTLPVFSFSDVYVSMDVMRLIRGTYMVSEVRLVDGIVNYLVGEDSVSNVEKALGITFGGEHVVDTLDRESSPIQLDLESLEVTDLEVNYKDLPADRYISVHLNSLESGFSYYPERIIAEVDLTSEILLAKMKELTLDRSRSVAISSAVHFDQEHRNIVLDHSMLELKDALFELEGDVNLESKTLDLDFNAVNSGIDLLNFLLTGVLDMDAIEQIGDGSIRLEGNASGSYHHQVPLVKVNVAAADMGFRVHSINQSVTGISFEGYLTNGTRKDLSEAEMHLRDFHVDFQKGALDADIHVTNLQQPYADISLSGDADLSVINEIIKTESIDKMKGTLSFSGDIIGTVNKKNGKFLDRAGVLEISMADLGFTHPGSGSSVHQLNGKLLIREKMIGLRDISLLLDSNQMNFAGNIHNLLPWLLEFDDDPHADIRFSAEELYTGTFLNDTAITEPVRNLGFNLSVYTEATSLKRAMEVKSIPSMELVIGDFEGTFPGYAPFSEGKMATEVKPDTVTVRGLHARIGESAFDLEAMLINYDKLIKKDSSARMQLAINLSSNRLVAGDLLTLHDEFRYLPSQFAVEEVHDFKFKGKVETSVSELLKDSLLPDFRFVSEEMRWKLMEYPNAFKDLALDVERKDSLLQIREFSGTIGESNFNINASVANLLDSTRTISGDVQISSELLDIDGLLAYALLDSPPADPATAKSGSRRSAGEMVPPKSGVGGEAEAGSVDLSKIDLPDLALDVDIRELRIVGNTLKNMDGRLATKPYKILYFDKFKLQSETGGYIMLDGQFNVSDPGEYLLSAKIEIDTVNVSDFDLQIAIGDTIYSLEDNFNGVLSADGLAELVFNTDFSINSDLSTAMFNMRLEDGRVQNFTPLRVLAKYTGNKNLANVKFGMLRNSITLMNGAVQIPLMSIESTLGLILLEGEQYLDGDFLYLARMPVSLVRGTVWNMLTNPQSKETNEDEVQQMSRQRFMLFTVSGKNGTEEVKVGDKRDQFR